MPLHAWVAAVSQRQASALGIGLAAGIALSTESTLAEAGLVTLILVVCATIALSLYAPGVEIGVASCLTTPLAARGLVAGDTTVLLPLLVSFAVALAVRGGRDALAKAAAASRRRG